MAACHHLLTQKQECRHRHRKDPLTEAVEDHHRKDILRVPLHQREARLRLLLHRTWELNQQQVSVLLHLRNKTELVRFRHHLRRRKLRRPLLLLPHRKLITKARTLELPHSSSKVLFRHRHHRITLSHLHHRIMRSHLRPLPVWMTCRTISLNVLLPKWSSTAA